MTKGIAYNYLINMDKRLKADYEERDTEINYLYVYPSIFATAGLFYLIKKARESKVPQKAKM